MVIGYSLVSWRWGRFEEVDLCRDVVLVDSGSVGRKWLQMRGSSQAVGPQDASVIGGDGRDSDVVPCLAFRSRCRLLSVRVSQPIGPPHQTKDGLQMSDRWVTDSYQIDNREPTSSMTNPPQTLCQ